MIVRGGEVANHAGRGMADVGVTDGKIVFIGDLKAKHVIRHADMASHAGWTPFDGFEAMGKAMATIVRGRV